MSDRGAGTYLSVVIPAYNEERRLPATLAALRAYLERQPYAWEVLVVDDGSTDGLPDVVSEVAANDARVRLLRYPVNRGKGHAVRLGMVSVRGERRLFMDADNSTALEHINEFFEALDAGADIAIGSRATSGAQIMERQPRWKELLGKLGNRWIRLWAAPGFSDTQAGFKMFSARAASDIFSRLTLDGWGFDAEALAVARLLGYRVVERPIRWTNDPHTRVTLKTYCQVLGEMVKIRLNLWRGKYGGKQSQGTTPDSSSG